MRIIIYGAGAIGGVIGGHLSLSGSEVILIGRPGHMNAVRENGLRFINPDGTHILEIPAVTTPDQIEFRADDVVLLCAKGQNTEEAMTDLCKAAGDNVPVFCCQNGVRNEEIASTYFARVYGVMVRVGGIYVTNGEVTARRDPPGWLIIGRYPEGKDDLAEDVAGRLRDAGFIVLTTDDVMPHKWGKLMMNLSNAVVAITGSWGDDSRYIIQAAQQEADDLLIRAGIGWVSQEELAQEWPESTMKPRKVLKSEAQSSTWQSLTRRQGTVETEFLTGEFVRLAERLGTRAPVNEALLRITLEMAASRELPGKYSPDVLGGIIGLEQT